MLYLKCVIHCFAFTDDLKLAMIAEAKDWKLLYGRSMNSTYSQLMEKIMEQIDDLSKRLSRNIKDLDDVRQAMASLKELRENEIYIDTSLDPIEVRTSVCNRFPVCILLQVFC